MTSSKNFWMEDRMNELEYGCDEHPWNPFELSPIHTDPETGIMFKRDDLFQPWGPLEVNGGKVRQFNMLLRKHSQRILIHHNNTVVVQTSVHSTSGTILAAVAAHRFPFIKVIVCVGGLKQEHLDNDPMMRLAKHYGA